MTVTTEWVFLRGYASQGGAIRARLNADTPEFQIYVAGDYSGDQGVGTPTTDWVFIYGRPGDELSVRIRLNAGSVELQQWYQGRFIGDGITSTENTNPVFLLGSSAKSGDNTIMFSIIDGTPAIEHYINGEFIGGSSGGGGSASVPDAVDDLASSAQTETSVTLTWTAPANNGAAITDYVVEYREGTAGAYTVFSDGTSASTGATVTGLTNLTSYQFRVAAVNSEGTGAYSNVLTQATDAPFANNANTFFYDFTSSQNTTETTGDDTLAVALELLGNGPNLTQVTKDYQPLIVSGGIDGNTNTARQMTFDTIQDIANGTDGWYIAFNAQFASGNSYILNIARNASTTPSRGQVYITASRNFGVKADSADGGAPNWIGYTTNQITFGTWYTFEARLVADGSTANPLTLWLDGVEQALTAEDATAFAQFASTVPSEVILFNDTGNDESLDGTIQDLVFHNGNPSSTIRSEVSTYLQGVKP